jgi:LysM repeat protein
MKLLLAFIFTSFFSMPSAEDNRKLAETYISSYKDVAVQEMHRTGIPASIKLAQGLLESDWGRSDLAKTANNHFGIKCGGKWTGGTFYKEDDDKDAKGRLIESCFRSFSSPTESYMAHSDFLSDPKKDYRYGFLFNYDSTDYKSWAKGLKKSGYATDPKYPKKLVQIIENYKLYKFDQQVKGKKLTNVKEPQKKEYIPERVSIPNNNLEKPGKTKTYKRKEATSTVDIKHEDNSITRMPAKYVSRLKYGIDVINKCRKVTAKGGETLGELSRAIGLSVDELIAINEIYETKDEILAPGVFVYLEKKKRSFRGDFGFHVVREDETMQSIAQLYGIRVKSLYAKNRMPKASKTIKGVKLSISKSVSLSERPRFVLASSDRKHKFLFEEEKAKK